MFVIFITAMFLLHFYIVLVLFFGSLCNSSVSIKFKGITIIGRKLKTLFVNKEYMAFYNIPYARPATNEARFKPPKAYNPLSNYGTYDYRKPHRNSFAIENSEDCLYLSIFTPTNNNKTENFPVLVWTHEHANSHGPDFFIEEDVLVVTVSFRSSIIGFLNTEDEFAEGNMGAKDILTALKWLRDNISLFNGDPSRVTIFGSGVGATPVASMLVSDATNDLFRRAVIIDGSALSPADYRSHNSEVLNKLYCRLQGRYDKFDRKELYKTLLNITFAELIMCCNLYDSTEVRDRQRLVNTFTCSIEKSSTIPFMNKSPINVYDRKLLNKSIDVIFGYTTLTNLYKLKGLAQNRKLLHYLNYNFQYLLPFEGISDEYNSKRYKKIKQKIMNFYFLNGTIGERSLRRYAKYISDQKIYPLLRQAELHSESSRSNVYLYRFPYKGSLNVGWEATVPNLKWSGATLGDEICYLFKCKLQRDVYQSAETSNERRFIKNIVRLFGNFVKYGNPTPDGSDNVLGTLRWATVGGKKKLQAMNLGRHFKMIDVPEEKRKYFWDQLRKEYF